MVAWQIAHTKQLAMMQITKSSVPILHDCPVLHINPNAPHLHGYKTHYISNNEFSGKHVNESEHSMPMTLHFEVLHFSSLNILFLELPRMPPKGFINSILVNLSLENLALPLCRHAIARGHSYAWQRLKLLFNS
jgi:hypothetical protein